MINISQRAWARFENTKAEREDGAEGPLTPWELYYLHWKGLVCKLKGLEVLIDDRKSEVLLGCEKYGIAYFHPDVL